ncbi:MAG: trigger factor [Verrucomicrobia bacterium]|nr:trigger factor [Verrucomicrobiota bacterium]
MPSTLDKQPHCITALSIEIPAERVGQEREKIVQQYVRFAQLPGYRAGKAPRPVVEAKFKGKISEELHSNLVSAGISEAIKEHSLRVLTVAEVNDVKLEKDGPLTYSAKVVTAPEFELPNYKKLEIRAPENKIEEADIDRALEEVRTRLADFEDVTGRALAMDDFAVLDLAGRIDGQPLSEVVSQPNVARDLGGRENFWIKLGPGNFLPGFCEAIVGMEAGETREVPIELDMEFPIKDLAARRIDYTVKLREIKNQVLPEVNDEFAEKVVPGKTLAELRELVREDLTRQKTEMIEQGKRRQIIAHLNAAVEFELPQHLVRNQTQRIASEIVQENQQRGVSDDEIVKNQGEIATNSASAARERLKTAFLLVRIAEAEGIKVTPDELKERITAMAVRYRTSYDKMLKDLQENDALSGLEEEVLIAKTLAALTADATVLPLEESAPQPA